MKYTQEVKTALCFRWNMEWRTVKKHIEDKDSAIATHPDTLAIMKSPKKAIQKIIS